MTERLRIRPAVADDAEAMHAAIRKLADGLGQGAFVRSTAADLRRHGFGEHPAFEAAVAEIGKDFAGACLFFPSFSSWNGMRGAYVLDLFVEKRFRGMRVGRALLAHVAGLTASRGGAYLRLSVDRENPGAETFYRRLGFSWKDEERILVLRGPLFDALTGSEKP